MRLLHAAAKTDAGFDDPNPVSHAGLVPAMRLAERVGMEELAAQHVQVTAEVGADAGVKIGSLIAGMIVGADDIHGMEAASVNGSVADLEQIDERLGSERDRAYSRLERLAR